MPLDPQDRRIFEEISRSLNGIQDILKNSTIRKPSWNAPKEETTAEVMEKFTEMLQDKLDTMIDVMRTGLWK
jgi:hypothetical protein